MAALRPLLIALSLCGLLGCGPVRSTAGIVEAEKVVRQVRETGADARLPYPATLAEELLEAAREAQGYADYEASYNLAVEAKERAQEVLNRAAAGESWRPPPPAPEAGSAASPEAEPPPAPEGESTDAEPGSEGAGQATPAPEGGEPR